MAKTQLISAMLNDAKIATSDNKNDTFEAQLINVTCHAQWYLKLLLQAKDVKIRDLVSVRCNFSVRRLE
ncbi:12019_t:CDS:2 [Dentiscutata erythropus]|uniref:12019_t:CDS:1 n=1 Tax=Dentiscutata erythropus TaxID=1348616 RepID=A0A9N8VGH9_9GLOM|nr:12019_t:CDS:2 [Dentiscutata erythropus]